MKQRELRRAIVNSLNVDPSFTEDNVELVVRRVEKKRRQDVVQEVRDRLAALLAASWLPGWLPGCVEGR